MGVKFLMSLVLAMLATSAQAADYLCPKHMTMEKQTAAAVDGFEVLNTDKATGGTDAHYLEGISLYSGHPREQASLAPDNADSAKGPWVWTTAKDDHGYWMECRYMRTSLVYVKKIGEGSATCKTIESTKPKQSIGFQCK
jgi:hypothetical protein